MIGSFRHAWWPTGALLALHRSVAVFTLVVPLPNLSADYSIVTESRPNLPIGFHFVVAQLLWKFDAVALLQSLRHFRCNKKSRLGHCTLPTKRRVPATYAIGRQKKIHACARKFKFGSRKRSCFIPIRFSQKKNKFGYFCNRRRISQR